MADEVSLDEILDDLGLAIEPGPASPAVAVVTDRLASGADRAAVDEAAQGAAEAWWSPALERELRRGLERLREEYTARLAALDAAEAELERPPRENALLLALVARASVELWARARKTYSVISVLEDELRDAPPSERRARTLVAATAVIPVLELDPAVVDHAVNRFLAEESEVWLARELATDERRRALRRALGRLADAGENEFPLATAALTALLAEPMAPDPADDELWVGLVVGLAQQHLDFEPG